MKSLRSKHVHGPPRWRLTAIAMAVALVAAACGNGEPADEAAEEPAAEPDVEEPAEEPADPDAEPFYEGATLNILLPYAEGGGNDTLTRWMAPFFQEAIPGNPTINILNRGGAGGVLGANEFELTAPRDGSHVMLSAASDMMAYLLGQEGVEYDYRDWQPIFGLPAGGVVYVRPDSGVAEIADLADMDVPLQFPGQAPTGADGVFALAFDILDINVESTWGYEGSGPTRIAFEQGEANIDRQSTIGFLGNVLPLVEAGEAIPLWAAGQIENGELVRDPAFPDLPHLGEVYEELHGEQPSGPAWEVYLGLIATTFTLEKVLWAHGDAPEQAVAELRQAAVDMVADPAFYEQGAELFGDYRFTVGDDIEPAVAAAFDSVEAETMAWYLDYLEENFDIE